MRAIVTVKIEPQLEKTNLEKQAGSCSLQYNSLCTDVEGKHHSFLCEGESVDRILREVGKKYGHITRVEVIKD